MKLNAQPNLNGNSPEDFTQVYMLLGDAYDAIDKAAKALYGNVLHGRNYQHSDDDTLIQDRRKVQEMIRGMQGDIGTLASAIVDILMKDEVK
jgi:hypothetical protein